MSAHKWIGRAFFALSDEQAARVSRLELPVTECEQMPDRLMVGCAECDAWWSASVADRACPGPAGRTSPAAGRNEPCPCGSGQKYKRCHGGS